MCYPINWICQRHPHPWLLIFRDNYNFLLDWNLFKYTKHWQEMSISQGCLFLLIKLVHWKTWISESAAACCHSPWCLIFLPWLWSHGIPSQSEVFQQQWGRAESHSLERLKHLSICVLPGFLRIHTPRLNCVYLWKIIVYHVIEEGGTNIQHHKHKEGKKEPSDTCDVLF